MSAIGDFFSSSFQVRLIEYVNGFFFPLYYWKKTAVTEFYRDDNDMSKIELGMCLSSENSHTPFWLVGPHFPSSASFSATKLCPYLCFQRPWDMWRERRKAISRRRVGKKEGKMDVAEVSLAEKNRFWAGVRPIRLAAVRSEYKLVTFRLFHHKFCTLKISVHLPSAVFLPNINADFKVVELTSIFQFWKFGFACFIRHSLFFFHIEDVFTNSILKT